MEVDYLAILACAIAASVLGFVWFGPLFGKRWMRIIGANTIAADQRREMRWQSAPLYVISFILSLFQAYVLARFIAGWNELPSVLNALWICAAFVIPTIAAGAMWNTDSRSVSLWRFGIQAGYYFILFLVYGLILTLWPW